MRNIKGLLVVISLFASASAMANGFIANTLQIVQCVDGKGLGVAVSFNTAKGKDEAQITHKVLATGFAQPRSIILLKAPTPVVLKTSSGDNQVWLGQGFKLEVSTTHLFPNGLGHLAYVQAVLDNGKSVAEQVSCRFITH